MFMKHTANSFRLSEAHLVKDSKLLPLDIKLNFKGLGLVKYTFLSRMNSVGSGKVKVC